MSSLAYTLFRFRTLPCLALTIGAASLFAQDVPDPVVFAAVRIGSLDKVAAAAGAFADKIQPGVGANAAQIGFGAAMFGIDSDAEILAVLLDPKTSRQPYAIVLSVVDPEAFKKNPAFAVRPADKPDVFRFTAPGGQPLFGAFVEKRLVAAPDQAALATLLPAVRADLDIRGLRAADGQIAVSLSPDLIYGSYKPMIDMMLLGMRGQFAQDTAAGGPNPADVLASLFGTVSELQEFAFSYTFTPDHLDLRARVIAKPGSDTAALLSPGRGPAVTTLGLHSPESAMRATISAKPGPEFWEAYSKFTARLLAASQPEGAEQTAAALSESIREFAAVWDGTASFGVFDNEKNAISGGGVAGVNDPAKALALLRALPELQKKFAALNEAQGLVTELVVGEETGYKDARLIDATQSYRATSPEMEASLSTLRELGMDRMPTTYAVSGDHVLYSMGEGAHAAVERMVDAVATPPAAAVGPADYDMPARSTVFGVVSLPRYASWVRRVAKLPVPAVSAPADAKPGYAFSADIDSGRADLRVRVEATEIAKTIEIFSAKPTETTRSAAGH